MRECREAVGALGADARGVAGCPQGLLGFYADENAPVNRVTTGRAPLEATTTFRIQSRCRLALPTGQGHPPVGAGAELSAAGARTASTTRSARSVHGRGASTGTPAARACAASHLPYSTLTRARGP